VIWWLWFSVFCVLVFVHKEVEDTDVFRLLARGVSAGGGYNEGQLWGRYPMANFLNVRGSVRVALAALSLTGLIASSAANAIGEIELTKSLVLTPTAGDASGDNPVTYQAGDVLNYTITATNTGSVDATNLNIGDSLTNVTGCSLPATVTPGQSITCNASYVIQQSDIDGAGFVHNEATATYVTEGDQAQFTTASVDAASTSFWSWTHPARLPTLVQSTT